MLPLNYTVDIDTERRRALGCIYDFLLRLAEQTQGKPKSIEPQKEEVSNEKAE